MLYLTVMTGNQFVYRRLQRIGGGSLFISLPREWVLSKGLKKGSLVSIEVAFDGSLIIRGGTPPAATVPRTVRIEGTSLNEEEVGLKLQRAYISGTEIVDISMHPEVSAQFRNRVRKEVEVLPGLELADEGDSFMTYRFLLDMTSMKPDQILRRMSVVSSVIYLSALREMTGEGVPQEGVGQKVSDLMKLYNLGFRLLNACSKNPSLSAELGVPGEFAIDYLFALYNLKRIGEVGEEIHKAIRKGFARHPPAGADLANKFRVVQDMTVLSIVSGGKDSYQALSQAQALMHEVENSITLGSDGVGAGVVVLCLLYEIARSLRDIAVSATMLT